MESTKSSMDPAATQEQYMAALERKNRELEDALQAAEETNQAKSRFLSNMSHDIRTPMNAIMGMTSIALSHIDEKARVQDCLGKIQTAAVHLMSLVNDVLDMSRIDSGRIILNEENFSLADLIHDISVIVRPQAAQKNQTLRIEIGRIEEESLLGDPLHLRQILVNIIGNAVEYTQTEGEIEVRFAQHFAESAGTDEPERQKVWLDFYCKDNGIGMSQEFLEKIFDPFERVHSEATSKIEGTGLGMSIGGERGGSRQLLHRAHPADDCAAVPGGSASAGEGGGADRGEAQRAVRADGEICAGKRSDAGTDRERRSGGDLADRGAVRGPYALCHASGRGACGYARLKPCHSCAAAGRKGIPDPARIGDGLGTDGIPCDSCRGQCLRALSAVQEPASEYAGGADRRYS